MSDREVGLRLSVKDRVKAAKALHDTADDVEAVDEALDGTSKSARTASREVEKLGGSRVTGGLRRLNTGLVGVGNTLKKGVVVGAKAGVAALAAIGATAVVKGFGRLKGIEEAQASLRGLGHDSASIQRVMDSSLDSVRGTAFGLADAAQVGASSVAAGVKPGQDLTRTLSLVADAATIAKTGMGEMGQIFNKVATSNKVQGEVIAQLSDRGIPIVQLLAKELGITTDAVMEMSRKGTIGFDTFQNAMEKGLGGAAATVGSSTLQGAVNNTLASLGRIGAGLLGGVYPQVRGFFQGAIGFLGQYEDRAATTGAWIGEKLAGGITWAQGAYATHGPRIRSILGGLRDVAVDVGNRFGPILQDRFGVIAGVASDLGGSIMTNLVPALGALWQTHGPGLLDFLQSAAQAFDSVLMPAIEGVGGFIADPLIPAISDLIGWMSQNADILAVVGGAWVAYKAVMLIAKGITLAQAAATAVATGAQTALNLALTMNPVGLVVAGVALLIGGLVLLYRRSETFRNAVNGLWSGVLKPFGSFVGKVLVGYFKLLGNAYLTMAEYGLKAFGWLTDAAFNAFDKILGAAETGLGWIPGFGDKISGAREKFREFSTKTKVGLDKVADAIEVAKNKLNGINGKKATVTLQTVTTRSVSEGGVIPSLPRLATGGPVMAGRSYLVGERRPEVFVPRTSGRILPRVNRPEGLRADGADAIAAAMESDGSTLSAGPAYPGGPITIQVMLPDRRVLAEAVLDHIDEKAARR